MHVRESGDKEKKTTVWHNGGAYKSCEQSLFGRLWRHNTPCSNISLSCNMLVPTIWQVRHAEEHVRPENVQNYKTLSVCGHTWRERRTGLSVGFSYSCRLTCSHLSARLPFSFYDVMKSCVRLGSCSIFALLVRRTDLR